MRRNKILLIGGSLNQTSMMHAIANALPDCDTFFTPFYSDGFLDYLNKAGLLDFCPIGDGGPSKRLTVEYIRDQKLPVDYGGLQRPYDLVITCTDIYVQQNIRRSRIVLVQEGMTDPETFMYRIVKKLRLPRYLASTSTYGLSDNYVKFCVASQGYRDFFTRKGVNPGKIVVTGIPNYDHLQKYCDNDFPHRGYVLVATSDARETYKWDNRKKFIAQCVEIAAGKQLIFKLHPNEKIQRATREINKYAPGALVYSRGPTEAMIANCDTLITQYSTVVYTGLALDKNVFSYFDVDELRRLTPIQNNGTSAENIARVCRSVMNDPSEALPYPPAFKTKMKSVISKWAQTLRT